MPFHDGCHPAKTSCTLELLIPAIEVVAHLKKADAIFHNQVVVVESDNYLDQSKLVFGGQWG